MTLSPRPTSLLLGLVAVTWFTAAIAAPPEPARQQALLHLLHQDCGACHGMQLKGGLGPALTPDALAGKPVDSLIATVLYGRPGTAMPPWKPFMNETEAAWLIHWITQDAPTAPPAGAPGR